MLRYFRIALMWLLALAVPAQGFAAASMINCGPGHHGVVQRHSHAAHAHSAEATAPHSHDDASPFDSHMHDASASATDGGSQVAKVLVVHKGSCNACASCCTAAALPTPVVTFDATPAPTFVVPLAPRGFAAFLTDGPERPPRSILV